MSNSTKMTIHINIYNEKTCLLEMNKLNYLFKIRFLSNQVKADIACCLLNTIYVVMLPCMALLGRFAIGLIQ